ncbi:MAG: cbb3-type cytochrome oxidase subunit 3 [Gammaproteobacteria bacterium]
MEAGTLFGLFTLLLLVTFIGIVAWAFSKKRRKHFEDAGHIPLQEDHTPASRNTTEK